MRPWQLETLDQLRDALPHCRITPYGSLLAPDDLDGWSDVDARIHGDIGRPIQDVLGAAIWAVQESRTEEGHQLLRLVLVDGRRLDLTIDGASVPLPPQGPENQVRFDAALAAVRFGRGADLIGLHLTLGILREALVQPMLLADRAEGTNHHRHATTFDARAAEVADLLQEPLGPRTAYEALRLHGTWTAETGTAVGPDLRGLAAVIDLAGPLVRRAPVDKDGRGLDEENTP